MEKRKRERKRKKKQRERGKKSHKVILPKCLQIKYLSVFISKYSDDSPLAGTEANSTVFLCSIILSTQWKLAGKKQTFCC